MNRGERRRLTPGEVDPMLIELVQGAGFARISVMDAAGASDSVVVRLE